MVVANYTPSSYNGPDTAGFTAQAGTSMTFNILSQWTGNLNILTLRGLGNGGTCIISVSSVNGDGSTGTQLYTNTVSLPQSYSRNNFDLDLTSANTTIPPHVQSGTLYRIVLQNMPSYLFTLNDITYMDGAYHTQELPTSQYYFIADSYTKDPNSITVLFPFLIINVFQDGSVNGGWSAWSSYGACSATCGGGTQSSTRTCNNPTPQLDGANCTGSSVQTQQCNLQACPQDGGWSAVQWGPCSASCGDGTQTGTRVCNNPYPNYGGAPCTGPTTVTQACNMGGCPQDGGWSDWSQWSQCSADCGGGTQSSTRTCTNPAPQNGGAQCTGTSTKSQSCNIDPCPQDGGWTDWSEWSQCSADCGGGTQLSTRTCTNPAPQYGGQDCVGDSTQTQACNTQACAPLDGGWTDWVAQPCNYPCGGGTQILTRTCTNPAPQYGGQQCTGDALMTQPCNLQPCAPAITATVAPATVAVSTTPVASTPIVLSDTSDTTNTTVQSSNTTTVVPLPVVLAQPVVTAQPVATSKPLNLDGTWNGIPLWVIITTLILIIIVGIFVSIGDTDTPVPVVHTS